MKDLSKRAFVILLTVAVCGSPAAAADRSAAIRAALEAPELTFKLNYKYSYSVVDGFVFQWRTPTAEERRDAAEQQIRSGRADAVTFYDLAEACSDLGDNKAATGYFTKAARLFKKQMSAVPAPRIALAGYAETLIQMKRDTEAAALLHRGLARDPGNWMAWLALADALTGEAPGLLWGKDADHVPHLSLAGPDNTQKYRALVVAWIKKNPPTAAAVAKAAAEEREAETALDRAVTVAPAEPWPLLDRGMLRVLALPWLTGMLSIANGQPPPATIFDVDAADPDIQAAARVDPANYQLQAAAAISTWLTAAFHDQGAGSDKLTPGQRSEITADMDRIRKTAQTDSGVTASNAFVALALLQAMTQGGDEAVQRSARAALRRDPANDFAFEFIVAPMANAKQFASIRDFCKEQIKRHDSASRRVILARAETHLGDNAAAEQDARAAIRLSPHDFDATLSLAALLLKDHTDPAAIGEAERLLAGDRVILGKDRTADRWASYALVDAAYLGIRGHADAARPLLNDEVKSAPSDDEKTEAKALLTALGHGTYPVGSHR